MQKLKVHPLGDRIVVKAITKEEMTQSGLYLPDTVNKEKPEEGEVIAVGPGRMTDDGKRVACEVKVGDKVLFSKYGPTEIKLNEEDLLVLSENDILAVIK